MLFPVIDACLDLRPAVPAPEAIARLTVRGHPLLLERTDRPAVDDGRSAKVSLQHSVAVALLYGAAGLAQYEDRCVREPAVRALAAKVTAEADPAIPVESAEVVLDLAGGETRRQFVRHGRGTPGRPMSEPELDAKVAELAAATPFVDAGRLIAAIRAVETLDDAGSIVNLCVRK